MRPGSLALLIFALGCGGSEKKAEPAPGIELGERPETRRTVVPEEEEDDGSLQVSGLRGHLDTYDIQRGVEPHAQALTDCYSSISRRRRYVGGAIELAYVVARTGEVKSVRTGKSDLGSWVVEKCLLEVAAQMSFPRPKGGEAEFSLPLEFTATRPASWIEEEVGRAQIEPVVSELDECAAEAKVRKPRDVVVTLYVGARGAVQSVGFATAAKKPLDPAWADCAETRILAWTLADPLGRIAKLSFPYNRRR